MIRSISGKMKYILGIAIILMIAFLCCVGYMIFRPKNIPELKKIEVITSSVYEMKFGSFDGEKLIFWYDSKSSDAKLEKSQQLANKIINARGREVTDWSIDKITYPIYTVTISTIYPVDNYYGESIVWSNGYLMISSGKIYKCNLDFFDFIDAGANVFENQVELDADSFIGFRWFRSMHQAGAEWHPEYLKASPYDESVCDSGIVTEIMSEEEDSGFISVKLHITNNTDKSWDYNKYPFDEVIINGTAYTIPFDPVLSDTEGIHILSEKLGPGKDIKYSVRIARKGMLPSGEYRILIHGQIDGEDCFAAAKYVVE